MGFKLFPGGLRFYVGGVGVEIFTEGVKLSPWSGEIQAFRFFLRIEIFR